MEPNLHHEFIATLVNYYGEWHKVTSKFGNHSFGEIADELCVSASQFSKLISGTATEGMYVRSIRNVQQLKHYHELEQTNQTLQVNIAQSGQLKANEKKPYLSYFKAASIGILGLILGLFTYKYLFDTKEMSANAFPISLDKHPLGSFFDQNYNSDFVSPYLYENEVQAFCPCNAYEGTWRLENQYKIPLPVKKSGVYYVAKSSDMRLKCMRTASKEDKGKILIGFENMIHEVWVDKDKNAFTTEYFDTKTKQYKKEFLDLEFEESDRFKKVADIHSFFFDQVKITPDSIYRQGEPCGRYVNIVNQDLANEYELDFKNLLKNIIGNMTFTDCNAAINQFCDPNSLKENESIMSFECRYTIKTENLGIGGAYPYSKGFRLVKQNYSDHVLCECAE